MSYRQILVGIRTNTTQIVWFDEEPENEISKHRYSYQSEIFQINRKEQSFEILKSGFFGGELNKPMASITFKSILRVSDAGTVPKVAKFELIN